MVEDTASGTNKNIDSISKLPCLIINAYATINGQNFEFVLTVLEFHHLIGHLKCKFSGWCQDDGLNSSCAQMLLTTEVLGDGKSESKCFARTC